MNKSPSPDRNRDITVPVLHTAGHPYRRPTTIVYLGRPAWMWILALASPRQRSQ